MTMKIQRSIFWFVAVIAVLAVLVLWFANRKPVEPPETVSVETNVPSPVNVAASNPQANAPSHINAPAAQRTNGAAGVSQSLPGNKAEQMIGILSTYNDVPIDFYGKVEDQFSNVVANAAVNFNVRVYNGMESTVKRGQVTTDVNGQFNISGYKGESLGLVPAKAGYALATGDTLFKYSHLDDQHYVPDQSNPTVIKMWKLQGAEPLTGINQRYKLPYTSAPMNFDLLTGQVVPSGGDIRITVNRPPGVISGQNRLDWSVQIEAVAGGLIDAAGQERITYSAPESGYQPSVTVFASTNGHGVELIQQGLFVQSRNGQVYSKVGIAFRINSEPDGLMYINFSGIANANGSRNWEGDPNTMNAVAK
jgi:hypothetical protein